VSLLRDELAQVDADLESLSKKQGELSEQEYNLHVRRTEVIKTLLVEEKPFEGTEWELVLGHKNQVYLKYLDGNETLMKEVRDLCFRSWHDSFELQDGIELHFDDGQYSLHFNEPRQLSIFAQKQSFRIVATDIEDKVRKLSKELKTLQEICHQFNLKA